MIFPGFRYVLWFFQVFQVEWEPCTLLACDLNCSVWGRVSSSRTSCWTPPNLNSEVSNPKILSFSYWFFMQIGWAGSVGHLQTLSRRCPTLRIKVRRCPETRPRTEPFRIHLLANLFRACLLQTKLDCKNEEVGRSALTSTRPHNAKVSY